MNEVNCSNEIVAQNKRGIFFPTGTWTGVSHKTESQGATNELRLLLLDVFLILGKTL